MFDEGTRLIILDEADSMTWDAQSALRQIIEKYSNNVRFCIICNYENKIIPEIKSRCASFRFNSISKDNCIKKLEQVAIGENINYDIRSLEILSNISNGDLRKAINLLQSINMITKDKITPEICWEITGIPSDDIIKEIYDLLCNCKNFNETLEKLEHIINIQAYSLNIILEKIIKLVILNINKFNPKILVELSELEIHIGKSMGGTNIHIGGLLAIFIKQMNI